MPEPFKPVIAVDINGFQVEVDANNEVRYTLESRWTHPFSEEDEDTIVRLVKEIKRFETLVPRQTAFFERDQD